MVLIFWNSLKIRHYVFHNGLFRICPGRIPASGSGLPFKPIAFNRFYQAVNKASSNLSSMKN
jgi:hypothetical protein